MLRKVRARRIASGLINELKIKKAPVNIEKVVKQIPSKNLMGLKDLTLTIREESFPSELKDVSAVLLKEKGHAIIAVNADHSEYRRRFSIAHEIGHLILHSNNEHLTVDRYEKQFFTRSENVRNLDEVEANEFAAALLMPEDLIKDDFEKYVANDPDEIISRLAEKYEVSQVALAYRLKNLNLL
jgi:Zn-dependent peptidase ImmA (M78 family)